ncbi:hypothetical protein [Streptomyces sp. CA-106131]|uniref:hypothetical protein n=1 Tax=Streptomyces sp. CA-106131 TaxID=3240045 RepID=UPI003D8E789B
MDAGAYDDQAIDPPMQPRERRIRRSAKQRPAGVFGEGEQQLVLGEVVTSDQSETAFGDGFGNAEAWERRARDDGLASGPIR